MGIFRALVANTRLLSYQDCLHTETGDCRGPTAGPFISPFFQETPVSIAAETMFGQPGLSILSLQYGPNAYHPNVDFVGKKWVIYYHSERWKRNYFSS